MQTQDERARARLIYGRALAALVAAQANWNVLSELGDEERTWAEQARVDLGRPDVKARSKLLEVANNALLGVALGSTRPQADDRLGTLGFLSPRSYELELYNPLKSDLRDHGLTKKEVADTVHNPDAYQHLSPPHDFNPQTPLISIFVRVLNRSTTAQREGDPEWSLIITRRAGRKISAVDAYWISRGWLKKDSGETPLDLFRAFCEVFGCNLMLGQTPIGKFLTYKRLQGSGQITAQNPESHNIKLSTMIKGNGLTWELAFGYAIDMTAYKEALVVSRPTLFS